VKHTYNIHEAKTHLSRLIEEAAVGEEVVIAKAGKPKVRLVAYAAAPKRVPGRYKADIRMADDFTEPLADAEIANWEGSSL
jgi:prevent-host-death family protein